MAMLYAPTCNDIAHASHRETALAVMAGHRDGGDGGNGGGGDARDAGDQVGAAGALRDAHSRTCAHTTGPHAA